MDSELLESWGKFLIGAAKVQRQQEQFMKWATQWFDGYSGVMDLFKKPYGPDQKEKESVFHPEAWMQPDENLKKVLNDYFKLFGFVPLNEYVELSKKYEELKEKCSAQEEALASYRMMKEFEGIAQCGSFMKQFQDLALKQTQQYQNTIDSFAKLLHQSE